MNEYLDLICKRYKNKKKNTTNWAAFYHFLNEIINESYQKTETHIHLGETIEVFFVITDLIDDLMDKDKEEVNVIVEKQTLLPDIVIKNLKELESIVSKKQYYAFIDHINKSLCFQYKESIYQVDRNSDEEKYFDLVKRSIYLVQAIAFLVNENIPDFLLTAIECYAISSQIINDVNDLKKAKSYDILDKKGTLPIIKSIELAKNNNDFNFIENYETLSRFNCSTEDYNKIIENIQCSGAIEYSQLVAFYYHKKSKLLFIQEAPSKKILIENYFDSLWR